MEPVESHCLIESVMEDIADKIGRKMSGEEIEGKSGK